MQLTLCHLQLVKVNQTHDELVCRRDVPLWPTHLPKSPPSKILYAWFNMKGRLAAFVAVSVLLVTYLFVHFALDVRPHDLTPSNVSQLGKNLLDLVGLNVSCPTVEPQIQCPPNQICLPKAKYLSPTELMQRPLSPVNGSIPKIIHQSWKSEELPDRFVRWSDTWRMHHPDWEWVLWTNDDNHALVDLHFPWFKKAYENLGYEILRADTARNMYMYIFGG
jgi:Glycosyltransferase sugar-binding region containing DXD motif